MIILPFLQVASVIFGLCSAALWGYAGYAGLSYDRFKRREARRAKREGRQPDFSAAVFNGKVMGSGNPELFNAIAALFAALAVLMGAVLAWTQPTSSCPQDAQHSQSTITR